MTHLHNKLSSAYFQPSLLRYYQPSFSTNHNIPQYIIPTFRHYKSISQYYPRQSTFNQSYSATLNIIPTLVVSSFSNVLHLPRDFIHPVLNISPIYIYNHKSKCSTNRYNILSNKNECRCPLNNSSINLSFSHLLTYCSSKKISMMIAKN